MQLLTEAVKASLECRLKFGIPLDAPCDVYELIVRHGLDLRFMEVTSLEGLYLVDGKLGQINVCAHRPSGLQRFIAAHELGHHVFGHGAMIDRELDYRERFSSFPKDEKLAEVFARFLLMPLRAVHKGFKSIGSVLSSLQPADVFRVSCWLGVGYSTLLHQMRFSLHMIEANDFERLAKTKPQQIKTLLSPGHGPYGRNELWPMHSSWDGLRVHIRIGDVLTGMAGNVSALFPLLTA
jgi:Zn-dependent peptidase ImmA (M78 family)